MILVQSTVLCYKCVAALYLQEMERVFWEPHLLGKNKWDNGDNSVVALPNQNYLLFYYFSEAIPKMLFLYEYI